MKNNGLNQNNILLDVIGLKKCFPVTKGVFKKVVTQIKAVDNISFHIYKGETLGLVGESGCGKTTTGRTVFRLIEPTDGKVFFNLNGKMIDFAAIEQNQLKPYRRQMAIIFQDPYSSLNPRLTIRDIIGDPLIVHNVCKSRDLDRKVRDLLALVGLQASYINRYPHEFSGGQRQRISIARALALNPKFIIADEPVSALDVSVQAQVLNLLRDLQSEFNLTYLFIAHDLRVVEHISDRIVVMYLGKIVEVGDAEVICNTPKHPYTEALISAIPDIGKKQKSNRIILKGEVPSSMNFPPGCHFHPRCPYSQNICSEEEPLLKETEQGSQHYIACHFFNKLNLKGGMFL